MFQPQYIHINSFPQNPILQLITLRYQSLHNSNAKYNQNFIQIEQQLNKHRDQYRKSAEYFKNNQMQSERILRNILEKVELRHYQFKGINMNKNEEQQKGYEQKEYGDDKKSRKRYNQCSNNGCEEKQQGKKITPYHFTKFKSSLNKFSLSCSKDKQNNRLKWNKTNKKQQNIDGDMNIMTYRNSLYSKTKNTQRSQNNHKNRNYFKKTNNKIGNNQQNSPTLYQAKQ